MHQGTMDRFRERVRNVHYRSMIWIANKLVDKTEIPQEKCNPTALFERMILFEHLSWGHYVCYLQWLNEQFPLNGPDIVCYLRRRTPRTTTHLPIS